MIAPTDYGVGVLARVRAQNGPVSEQSPLGDRVGRSPKPGSRRPSDIAMSARTEVATVAEIPPGEVRVVEPGGKALALANVDGTFYALDNTCLHRGGPLGEGTLEETILTCPWHGWRWEVTTGANANNPAVKVSCYPVTVENGIIYVDL